MNKPETILLDELVENISYWSKLVARSVADKDSDTTWSQCPLALVRLKDQLKHQSASDIELLVRDALIGFTHSFLVGLDGGSKMADKMKFRVVDQDGRMLPLHLHELFADRILDFRKE